METKGIIISQKDYERLTELEKSFNDKVNENKETFKKGLEDAIKGNLVKILWIDDPYYAKLKGCDLTDDGICSFISREDADFVDSVSSNESYDREKIIKRATEKSSKRIAYHKKAFGTYQEIIETQKRTFRNLGWAFGIMFMVLLVQLIACIIK